MATPNQLQAPEGPYLNWDMIIPDLVRMYIFEDLSMKDTMSRIKETHGFAGSERSFYDKIKMLGYQKNVKSHDMQWIIAKRTKRALEGKDTTFFCGSVQVPSEQIDNAKRRKTMERSLRVSTPPYITYNTPIPESEATSSEEIQDQRIRAPSPQPQPSSVHSLCVEAASSIEPSDEQMSQTGSQTIKIEVPETSMLDRYLSEDSYDSPWSVFSYRHNDERVLARRQQMSELIVDTLGHTCEEASRHQICCIDNQFLLGIQNTEDKSLSPNRYILSDDEQVKDDAEVVSLQATIDIEITLAAHQDIHGELASQTMKERFELAKAFERGGDHEKAEYHCRRILARNPQIDVQAFLGMILVNTSRLEDATVLLFSALTEFIIQFSLSSFDVNAMLFAPIEELFTELICRDYDHDWYSLTSCLIDIMTSIEEGHSKDVIDQVPSQLFLYGFSLAHKCGLLGLIDSAMHLCQRLLECSPTQLDAGPQGIEKAKAHRLYGCLLKSKSRWASSAEQVFLACESILSSGRYDSQLITVLETDYIELAEHLTSHSHEENSLTKRLTEILTRCRSQNLHQAQEISAAVQGSRIEDGTLSDGLQILLSSLERSNVSQFDLYPRDAEISPRSRDHTWVGSLSTGESNKYGKTYTNGSGCSVVSNSCFICP